MQYMTSGRMKLAEHARQTHLAVVPPDVTLDKALLPEFWTHVAHQVRPRDRIELWAEDRAWMADCVVVSSSRTGVVVKVLARLDLEAMPAVSDRVARSGYHVDYGGGVDLWRVIRDADSMVMVTGLSQAEAQRWMDEHVAGQRQDATTRSTPLATEPPPEAAPPIDRGVVVIPDGWEGLSWPERRSLASQVSDNPIRNGEDANAAITAELARRKESGDA